MKVTINNFFAEAQCDLSGKNGEAVEISTDDGTIRNAVISFRELQKFLRFRHKQAERMNAKPLSSERPAAGQQK